mgnify:CR=1 FL=1
MPTVIIRPDAIGAETGFDQGGPNLLSRINDNDTSTFVTQTNETANFSIGIENSSAYSGATINNVVVSAIGNTSGKASEASLEIQLKNAAETTLQTSTLNFGTTESTESTAEYSTGLTPSVVDGFNLLCTPDESGITIKEVFITVDYTAAAAATTPFIGMKSGKYKIVSGKVKI